MKVLFICTGNTWRSIAEKTIFENLCNEYNVSVSSVGLPVIPHSLASENSVNVFKNIMDINVDIYTETFFELKNKIGALIDKIEEDRSIFYKYFYLLF